MMWSSGSVDCGGGVVSMERSLCGDGVCVANWLTDSWWTQRRKISWWTIGTNRSRWSTWPA
jgi:hypothetical protein